VRFDSQKISLTQVLEIFFVIHDPTTLNRQGNDHGTQYRSGIYCHDAAQEAMALAVLAQAQAHHGGRAVTEVMSEKNYTRAEDYHQHYFANHPHQGYCAMVVAPKVEKFKKTFAQMVRPLP
jgi:peptide-methionine (S)-S-oxide reductase